MTTTITTTPARAAIAGAEHGPVLHVFRRLASVVGCRDRSIAVRQPQLRDRHKGCVPAAGIVDRLSPQPTPAQPTSQSSRAAGHACLRAGDAAWSLLHRRIEQNYGTHASAMRVKAVTRSLRSSSDVCIERGRTTTRPWSKPMPQRRNTSFPPSASTWTHDPCSTYTLRQRDHR